MHLTLPTLKELNYIYLSFQKWEKLPRLRNGLILISSSTGLWSQVRIQACISILGSSAWIGQKLKHSKLSKSCEFILPLQAEKLTGLFRSHKQEHCNSAFEFFNQFNFFMEYYFTKKNQRTFLAYKFKIPKAYHWEFKLKNKGWWWSGFLRKEHRDKSAILSC